MAIISSDRRVDWTFAGVPGGIPSRTTVYTVLTEIDNTGASDVSIDIQAALNACPENQVVVLPAGTFLIGTVLTIPHRVVLRGAGQGSTTLTGTSTLVRFYRYQAYATPVSLVGGASKGATSFVLTSIPSDLKAGMIVQIQEDDATYNHEGIEGGPGDRSKGQHVMITAIDAGTATISIEEPLHTDYTAALNPRIRYTFLAATPTRNWSHYSGLESCTLLNTASGSSKLLEVGFAGYSWCKDVTFVDAGACHAWLFNAYRCHFKRCTFDGILAPITSSRGYGIQTGTPSSGLPCEKTTSLLVEDCVFDGCRGGVILGYGASGCVVSYNLFVNTVDEEPTRQKPDIIIHSAFPVMNLIEGNVGVRGVSADMFHGNAQWNTVFRNWFKGKESGKVSALKSVELSYYHQFYNVVGNVLGYSGIVADVAALTSPAGESYRRVEAPGDVARYNNAYHAIMLGYYGEGGSTLITDTDVAATLVEHGNYDFVSGTQVWDGDIADHDIPDSLYLNAKPGWFAWLQWPPVDPGSPDDLGPDILPAWFRYTHSGVDAYDYYAPSDLTVEASGSSVIDLSWTDASSDEDGFIIERSLNGTTGWTEIADLPAGSTAYVDTGLSSGTTYYYRVAAYNEYGSSAWSDVASAATEPAPMVRAGTLPNSSSSYAWM